MGHTRGEPNEIELTAAHGLFYPSFLSYLAVKYVEAQHGDMNAQVRSVCVS